MSEAVSSITEAEALSGSARRQSLEAKVTAARASASARGKSLYIDRIHLALLEAAPLTSQVAADAHYAGVAQDMRMELGEAAGQAGFPVVVVCQSFGTRTDGVSTVALAEGRLHIAHWALGIVVATPRYPFDLVPGTAALHTPVAAAQIAELQNLAAMAKLDGGDWYCPSLESATINGATITATFSAMSNLALRDPANHGFSLVDAGAVTISSVTVSGKTATITLSGAPSGSVQLDYAYGQTGTPSDARPANRGSITDQWSANSRHGGTLYRYALANRVNVTAA